MQIKDLEDEKSNIGNHVVKSTPALQKLEDCLNALKDSMIHNYISLEFYKEI